ncbi:hypothetical protein, partial [Mesomycoplasma hyorhinis]|uniref:hypothetical protein n=1 Tax=Mesomycoplasma hyorhinis TaxID=2100 RepID=UPI001C0445CC
VDAPAFDSLVVFFPVFVPASSPFSVFSVFFPSSSLCRFFPVFSPFIPYFNQLIMVLQEFLQKI